MKTFALALVLCLAAPTLAFAHEGHSHGPPKAALSEDAVKARATEEVARLVSVKKVDATWKDVAVKSVEQKKGEWLVTFENPKAKANTTLYVFLKASGEFSAANFTGK